MKTVYLLCGVPASGKTWVAKQLVGKFLYIPHDEHTRPELLKKVDESARTSHIPLLVDCPFAERELRNDLEARRLEVIPIFIVEPVHIIRERYVAREKTYPSKNVLTRAATILRRAIEWRAPFGNSQEMLKYLKSI